MKAKFIGIIMALGFFCVISTTKAEAAIFVDSSASELEIEEIDYDLAKGGSQEFVLTDETGEVEEVIRVEEEQTLSDGIQLFSSSNTKTYTISRSVTGQWSASYKIQIRNGQITRAYGSSINVVLGKVTSSSLRVNASRKQATLAFTVDRLLIRNTQSYLRATIDGSRLKVTVQ
jgi:hypothetical protein